MSAVNLSTKSQIYTCNTCAKSSPEMQRCGGCRNARYCDQTCFETDRPIHKKMCNSLQKIQKVKKMCQDEAVEENGLLEQIKKYRSLCKSDLFEAETLGDNLLTKMDDFLKTGRNVIQFLNKILKWTGRRGLDSGPIARTYVAKSANLELIQKFRTDILSSQKKLREEREEMYDHRFFEILGPHFPHYAYTAPVPAHRILLAITGYL